MLNAFVIFFGKNFIFLITLLTIIFFFLQSSQIKKRSLFLGVPSLILSYILAFIAGKLYFDPRPFASNHFKPLIAHVANNGFPSDHALLSFTLASIVFVFNKKWGIVLFILGLFVSSARVVAGIHSPIDILGSFVISVL